MSTQSADFSPVPATIAVPPAAAIPVDVIETAERLGVVQHLPKIIDVTREIFDTFTRVRVMDDPEFAGDIHIIFHVPARGSVEEELDREDEWGRRVLKIIPRSPQVYLVFVDYPI